MIILVVARVRISADSYPHVQDAFRRSQGISKILAQLQAMTFPESLSSNRYTRKFWFVFT